MTAYRWRKSTHSGQQTNCVEFAHTRDRLRDSKNPAGRPLLVEVAPLFEAVKTGWPERRTPA
ncbi:MAG TPA: DUF397 domain-containing protein [Pseudonocardiaceae bacterium]|jgi:hypothetical protein|nr:DUF397 domain-containing protein [Pseudonocardiaceae bacterium]